MGNIEQYARKLRRFYSQHKRMPSYGELAALLKFKSKNAAKYLADKWVESGLMEKGEGGRLVPGRAFRALKLLGTVAAGWPSPAEEENVDTLSLDEWLIGNKEASFMLKVTGESMIDAGIRPGDMVILERGRSPKSGDIVVAEVDKEWTLKYFERRGGKVVLQPANKAFKTIVPQDELRVAGVVTAVVRKYF
ncbi:MAG: LexA repressor [Candidatus Parcubacteria bacterium]|jgi:repressor LexA